MTRWICKRIVVPFLEFHFYWVPIYIWFVITTFFYIYDHARPLNRVLNTYFPYYTFSILCCVCSCLYYITFIHTTSPYIFQFCTEVIYIKKIKTIHFPSMAQWRGLLIRKSYIHLYLFSELRRIAENRQSWVSSISC